MQLFVNKKKGSSSYFDLNSTFPHFSENEYLVHYKKNISVFNVFSVLFIFYLIRRACEHRAKLELSWMIRSLNIIAVSSLQGCNISLVRTVAKAVWCCTKINFASFWSSWSGCVTHHHHHMPSLLPPGNWSLTSTSSSTLSLTSRLVAVGSR